MKHYKDFLIVGIDHGYGNIKTANTVTPTGITKLDAALTFTKNTLYYDGSYYLIGEGHKEYLPDKWHDNDNYLFTLMGIARELNRESITSAKVYLAVGLPITWVGRQRESFRQYMLQRESVDFKYEDKLYSVRIIGCYVYPQGYAAVVEKLNEMTGLSMIADIGNGTVNIIFVSNKRVINTKTYTEKMGVNQCVKAASNAMMNKLGVTVDETIIQSMIRYGKADIDSGYADVLRQAIAEYAEDIFALLRNQKTVLNILEQEKYIGDTLWQKTYSKFMGEKFIPNSGQVPQYYIEGSHPAIISKEKFALVRDMRKASTPQKNTKVESPFRKKLICGKCGHTYALIRSKKRDYWQCGYRYDVGNPCDNIVLYDDELQTAFTALCDKLHTHNAEIIGKCYAQLTELQRLMEYGTAEGANQLKTIADLKEQKLRLATLYRKRFITTEKYDREVTEIDMQISRLSRSMDRSAPSKDKTIDDIETLAELFKNYDGTPEARKEILETAIESITISGDMLTFRLLCGLEFTERIGEYGK